MGMGEAFAAKPCARRMQHRTHSAFRTGTQGNGGIRLAPKPATQSIPFLLPDLDGSLVDSVYEHVMAWRAALEEAEIRLPNWEIAGERRSSCRAVTIAPGAEPILENEFPQKEL